MSGRIFTIGYGSRSIDELLALLKKFEIAFLVDIRSKPFSGFKPEFSKAPLSRSITEAGKYVFMGDLLGGQPDDPEFFTDGKADYTKMRNSAHFQTGIERLKTGVAKGATMALMCSEGKPEECHRSKLLGEVLTEEGLEVRHINEAGAPATHESVILKLLDGQPDFFGNSFTSRKRYIQP